MNDDLSLRLGGTIVFVLLVVAIVLIEWRQRPRCPLCRCQRAKRVGSVQTFGSAGIGKVTIYRCSNQHRYEWPRYVERTVQKWAG